jgi:hypothetical protein
MRGHVHWSRMNAAACRAGRRSAWRIHSRSSARRGGAGAERPPARSLSEVRDDMRDGPSGAILVASTKRKRTRRPVAPSAAALRPSGCPASLRRRRLSMSCWAAAGSARRSPSPGLPRRKWNAAVCASGNTKPAKARLWTQPARSIVLSRLVVCPSESGPAAPLCGRNRSAGCD